LQAAQYIDFQWLKSNLLNPPNPDISAQKKTAGDITGLTGLNIGG
jgi:hypothetical protein